MPGKERLWQPQTSLLQSLVEKEGKRRGQQEEKPGRRAEPSPQFVTATTIACSFFFCFIVSGSVWHALCELFYLSTKLWGGQYCWKETDTQRGVAICIGRNALGDRYLHSVIWLGKATCGEWAEEGELQLVSTKTSADPIGNPESQSQRGT